MSYERTIERSQLPTGLLEPQQAERLEALVSTLSPTQALWISGYLAGVGTQATPIEVSPAEAVPAGPRVSVLYATETGTAQDVAERLAGRLTQRGLDARAVDMAAYRTRELRDETHVVLVSATHGEGDPPDPATGFFEFLWSRKAPKLAGAKFAVLALGDSSYVQFCQAGKDLDARLEALGAERLAERVDCDVDYEDAAGAWIEDLAGRLADEAPAAPAAPGASNAARPSAPAAPQGLAHLFGGGAAAPVAETPKYSRSNPYQAEILDSIVLNGRHSDKETRHLELSLEDSGLAFEPGDSLGIVPVNDDRTVESVLDTLELPAEEAVRVGDEEKPLGAALKHDLELTMLTPNFLRAYAEAADADALRALLEDDNRDALRRFLAEHQVPDVLAAYPVQGLSGQGLADMLRRLQPRLYSIASSQAAAPDEVHLTVAVTRTTPGGKPRDGVASTYLAERRAPGERVGVYVHRNRTFKLPADPAAPIIMIGPGTGVAPFRSFLQEREETGATGRNWLFFGERTFLEDFLYQTDWQRLLKDGRLSRMDVAFSRDQAEKVYVQDRLRERARDVYAWLEDGAHLYVCGDAEHMAPAVHDALLGVLGEQGGLDHDAAESYLGELREAKRYQRDVY